MNKNYKRKLSLLYLFLIVVLFISLGLTLLYFNQNPVDLLLGAFFLILGLFFMLYLIKTNKSLNSYSNLSNYDERSEINRLKAADISFKFLFVSINVLILLQAVNPVPVEIFLAFLSPIMAFAIILYFSYYYYHERSIE
ncbi:MAG: hypothetical protein ACW981_14930 [Candidatus Hodarchaeales archaeon]|jgi:hypothetical protein